MSSGRRASSGRRPRGSAGRRGRPPRVALKFLCVLACSLLGVGVAPPLRSEAASGLLRRTGTLAIGGGDGLVADERTRRLIVLSGGLEPLTITAFDGDRFTRLAGTEHPGLFPQAGSGGRPRVFAFDEPARRLYLVAYGSAVERENLANPQLVTIEAGTFAITARSPLVGVFGPGARILGMEPSGDGRLVLAGQIAPTAVVPFVPPLEAPRATGVVVAEVDATTARVVRGPVVARGCKAPITSQRQTAVGLLDDRAFLGCGVTDLVIAPAPGIPAIVEVSLDGPTDQAIHFLPGSYATGDIFFDAAARRLLPVSGAAGSRPAQSMWVFDLEHRTFVGQIATGERNLLGSGFNPRSGRVYVGINNAVLISTDRGVEVPQATPVPLEIAGGPIFAVPFNRAVVIPVVGPNASVELGIFEDLLPPNSFAPGERSDPRALDALTTEEPQFSSDAKAYGARIRQIGGVNAALQNVLPLGGNYWRDPGRLTGLKDGDRDLTLGSVRRAHLGEGEASAESVAAEPDANTAADYLTIAGRAPGTLPETWPYESASCRDFVGRADTATEDDVEAHCQMAKIASATATYRSERTVGADDGEVSIGRAWSRTVVQFDPGKGLVATSVAEARDILIGTDVSIGRVVSVATAMAGSSKGGASYTRTFENVSTPAFSCTTQCDASAVAVALTAALGAQVIVELPAYETVATPGGAHAHAIREPWEHQQDVVVTSQDPTQLQTPALRLQFVNDSALASRVILELAGTTADATVIRLVAPPAVVEVPTPPLGPRVLPTPVTRPAVPQPPAPPQPGITERVVRTIGHGWKLSSSGPVSTMVRSVALWALLLSPAFFAARRRWLARLPGGSS